MAEVDLAFATVPRSEAARHPALIARTAECGPGARTGESARRAGASARSAVDRGPGHTGSFSDLSSSVRRSLPEGRRARLAHPLNRVERAQLGFAALALTALMTALIVVAFLGLAHLRAGGFSDRLEPARDSVSERVDHSVDGLSWPVR
ncbi:hypothetical protein [Nocardia halotolerans]